jgi:ribonuclease HI
MVPSLPLAHDPLSFTYTDASQQSAGESDVGSDIGCGVFSPFLSGPAREFYFRVPCSQSNIVRGELSAILHALLRLDPAPITPASISATVLTDSLTSLQLLHKHLHRPWLTASCPYQPLLQAIVDAAAALPQGVRIRKVRAHFGIRGNEAADAGPRQSWRHY